MLVASLTRARSPQLFNLTTRPHTNKTLPRCRVKVAVKVEVTARSIPTGVRVAGCSSVGMARTAARQGQEARNATKGEQPAPRCRGKKKKEKEHWKPKLARRRGVRYTSFSRACISTKEMGVNKQFPNIGFSRWTRFPVLRYLIGKNCLREEDSRWLLWYGSLVAMRGQLLACSGGSPVRFFAVPCAATLVLCCTVCSKTQRC